MLEGDKYIMLATMPSGTTHNVAQGVPANAEEDRLCAGCNRSVSSETGGVVVAFGNSLWHVDWCVLSCSRLIYSASMLILERVLLVSFKCAKCGNQVNVSTASGMV